MPGPDHEASPAEERASEASGRAPEWTLKVSSQEDGPDFADAERTTARMTERSGDASAQLVLWNVNPLHSVHFYIPTETGKLTPGEYPVQSVNVYLADPRRMCAGSSIRNGPPSVTATVTEQEPVIGTYHGTIRCNKGGTPYDVEVEGMRGS